MTKEQAQLFFRHSPEDDIDDLWEQKFFTEKQYFLTHPPLKMLWRSKLKRLTKENEAYLVLSNQPVDTELSQIQKELAKSTKEVRTQENKFSDNFISAFHTFHQLRNQHKSAVLQAQDMVSLYNATESWLDMESDYAVYWATPSCEQNEIEVLRSKEPDPMELLEELKKTQEKMKILSLTELKENYNILPELIKREVKRLTLLAKV